MARLGGGCWVSIKGALTLLRGSVGGLQAGPEGWQRGSAGPEGGGVARALVFAKQQMLKVA